MQPYVYLQQAAELLDTLQRREDIDRVLDELEFIQEALAPEHQELAAQLIEKLVRRREACRD